MSQGSIPGDPMAMSGMGSGLPPIEQHMQGNMGAGLHDLNSMRTPHGDIRTKQPKKEELFNNESSCRALSVDFSKQMSVDFSFVGPAESERSDDETFTDVTLEPEPDRTMQTLLPPIKMRSLFHNQGTSHSRELSYQVSTEREILTSDEDCSQASFTSSSLQQNTIIAGKFTLFTRSSY